MSFTVVEARDEYNGFNILGSDKEIRELRAPEGGTNDHSLFVNDYKDPVTYVSISGPHYLDPKQNGTFTAITQPTKRKLEIYYKWYYRHFSSKNNSIKGPPPGEWIYITEGYDKKSITRNDTEDFELKVEVEDKRYNNEFSDTHTVRIYR